MWWDLCEYSASKTYFAWDGPSSVAILCVHAGWPQVSRSPSIHSGVRLTETLNFWQPIRNAFLKLKNVFLHFNFQATFTIMRISVSSYCRSLSELMSRSGHSKLKRLPTQSLFFLHQFWKFWCPSCRDFLAILTRIPLFFDTLLFKSLA